MAERPGGVPAPTPERAYPWPEQRMKPNLAVRQGLHRHPHDYTELCVVVGCVADGGVPVNPEPDAPLVAIDWPADGSWSPPITGEDPGDVLIRALTAELAATGAALAASREEVRRAERAARELWAALEVAVWGADPAAGDPAQDVVVHRVLRIWAALYGDDDAWAVALPAAALRSPESPKSWRCEECHTPWIHGEQQCQRCGNRTRVENPAG